MRAAGLKKRRSALIGVIGLAALVALAGWLRWHYVQTISLYVDEFTTLWAAQRTLETGVPVLPSGVLYTRGLLATYVTALAGLAAGLDYTTGRMPSLLFGLATLLAIFVIGRRVWHARVGWLAALGLALLPEAIVWSGRARFYAQLQFFALLTLWAAFWSLQSSSRVSLARRQLIFAGLFVLSLFSQEQTVLLYPPLALATVLWCGPRFLFRRAVWPAHALILVSLAVRFGVELVGQPGFFETIQAERPYVAPLFDVAASWPTYAPLLVAPERLPWTLAGLLALSAALAALARGGLRQLPRNHQATLFFALPLFFVLAFILTLAGGQWRESRYLFLVQPLWLLLGAAGLNGIVERLWTNERWRSSVTVLLTALLLGLGWPAAKAVLDRQVEGYDRVFEYVAAQRQPGDIVLSPQPPACAFVLGTPCDYYAVQRVYEEFVIVAQGEQVDRWSGAKLLAETSQLQSVVATAPRVWLVTDAFRLATRYENDFQQLVIEQFDPVFSERGVIALLAQGWRAPPAYTTATTAPQPFGRLNLVGWQATAAQAGQPLAVVLHWQATAAVDSQLNSSLRLVAPDGRMVAQQDGPPARGILPTYLFLDTVLPDPKTLELPASLPAGRYRLEVVVYDVASGRVEAGPSTIGELDLTPQPDTTHDGVGLADPTGAATTHQKERRHAVQKAAVSAAG